MKPMSNTNIKSIREYWAAYLETVIPRDASTTQVIESRRCFYAGAAAIMNTVMEIGDNDAIDEMAGADIMEDRLQELHEFHEDVQRGRA